MFRVGALRWIPLELLAQLAYAALEGYSTRSERAQQAAARQGQRVDNWDRVWKNPTRDHRLRLRGPEVKEPPPGEEGVEVGAVEGWHLQTSRLHHRVA